LIGAILGGGFIRGAQAAGRLVLGGGTLAGGFAFAGDEKKDVICFEKPDLGGGPQFSTNNKNGNGTPPSSGRADNKLGPDKTIKSDHTTFMRDNNGHIYKYETYEHTKNGFHNPIKRFDGGKPDRLPGKPHNGMPTPHVPVKNIPGGVRSPEPWEIPNNPRFK